MSAFAKAVVYQKFRRSRPCKCFFAPMSFKFFCGAEPRFISVYQRYVALFDRKYYHGNIYLWGRFILQAGRSGKEKLNIILRAVRLGGLLFRQVGPASRVVTHFRREVSGALQTLSSTRRPLCMSQCIHPLYMHPA